jgi:hypothetical protein
MKRFTFSALKSVGMTLLGCCMRSAMTSSVLRPSCSARYSTARTSVCVDSLVSCSLHLHPRGAHQRSLVNKHSSMRALSLLSAWDARAPCNSPRQTEDLRGTVMGCAQRCARWRHAAQLGIYVVASPLSWHVPEKRRKRNIASLSVLRTCFSTSMKFPLASLGGVAARPLRARALVQEHRLKQATMQRSRSAVGVDTKTMHRARQSWSQSCRPQGRAQSGLA